MMMDKSGTGNGTVSAGAGFMTLPTAGDSGAVSFVLSRSEEYRTVTIAIRSAANP